MEYRSQWFKLIISIALGGAILWWMYRGVDFAALSSAMFYDMNWGWMLLSFPFGILAQAFRGWRWKQSLEPLGEHPRNEVCVNSIFLSYALSLIIPRVGEFARCGTLAKKDQVSFAKSLGTVVTERAIDTLLMLGITALVIFWQLPIFHTFFNYTGVDVPASLRGFSLQGYLVAALCLVIALTFIWLLLRKLSVYNKVRLTLSGLWEVILSLKNVENRTPFIPFTRGILECYFLHYYLTFYCFEATRGLSLLCALVTFVVGTIAVIVPTPNGAGPWHFAVKTMLVLYGVAEEQALYFVLIVHTVQTLLVALLGVYARIRLTIIKNKKLTI